MRPLGSPPTPSARSTAREPVVSTSTFILALEPSRMIEPSPNCLVMEERASSMFFSRTWLATSGFPFAAGAADFVSAGAALDMAGRGTREDDSGCLEKRRTASVCDPQRPKQVRSGGGETHGVFRRTRQGCVAQIHRPASATLFLRRRSKRRAIPQVHRHRADHDAGAAAPAQADDVVKVSLEVAIDSVHARVVGGDLLVQKHFHTAPVAPFVRGLTETLEG